MAHFRDRAEAVAWLRSPAAVRSRCGVVLAAAERGALEHFAFDASRLSDAAGYVIETMKAAYPALDIPFHSRWRHFSAGGVDRWGALAGRLAGTPPDEIARIRIDLAVTSVLLDAGAGPDWRYRDPATGRTFARSEGLAVASFDAFAAGLFSADPAWPRRADAEALETFTAGRLAAAFQVSEDNPLAGLEGRAALLRGLGAALRARPDVFGDPPRLGALSDWLAGRAEGGALEAAAILEAVLALLGPIWPGRLALGGVDLGDTWRHPAARAEDATDGLVPFHKLSQWLTYSLVEPLEDAGVRVTGLDRLTGLAEYRNGGLFVDSGVLVPRHDEVTGRAHPPESEVIVEWRALTVVLLDRLAERLRARLGLDAAALPLAKVLEGGTWAAGRRIAAEKRPGGPPPITLSSDGAVF